MIGGRGADFLDGELDHDLPDGGKGDDSLDGGAGRNTNYGGGGTDTCVNPDIAGGAVACEQ